MPTTWMKTGSASWTKIVSLFVKTSSAWSDMANAWVKTGSTSWTKVFTKPFVPKIATQVDITLATANSTTQTKKITGTLYNWTNATSVTYRFRKSIDDINYSNISGASGTSTNPASGSSNTNDTYTLTQSNLTANATNYFVYVSTANNSTYGTSAESVSYSTSFEMPRDITDLTATSASSSSISLTWTASLYAGRQMVEYKASSASTWTTSGNGAGGYSGTTTSATITGLTAGTNYDFRVLPWTGTSNNTGYYGNYSNTATAYPINNNKIPPTILSATQSTPGGQLDVVVYGGSGPAYQIYWSSSPTPPGASSIPDGSANWNNGSNTTVSDPTGVPSAGTWYVYARSVTSTGFTTTDTGNSATASYSEWSPNPGFQFTVTAPNLTAPTISSISGTAGNINVYFSGGSGPYYQVYWYTTNRSDIQSISSYDANGSVSPVNVTNLVAPTAGYTYYFWVRSVSSLTLTGTGPSSNISSWSSSSTWTAPVVAPSLTSFTISPTTPNVGTTITVTANWANSPTSISTKVTRGTQNVADFESTVSGPNASNTASYTIQSGDIGYYLAGFSTASNAGGTTGPSKTTSPAEIGPIVQPFVTPTWTGSFPSWTSSNFQRVTSGTANFRWGWGNGSFSWSGSTSGSGGWDFNISTTQLSTTANRSVSVTKSYTTSNDTYQTVNSTNYPYLVSSLRGDVTYSTSSRWGSIRPWINGTDNNKYTASSWSTGI